MARNNGMAIAKGEYILMPDSDDLLIENSVKPLLEKALETKADMIVADFVEMNDEGIKKHSHFQILQGNNGTPCGRVSGCRAGIFSVYSIKQRNMWIQRTI